MERVREWDPPLAEEFAKVPLTATGRTSAQRAVSYLEYRLLVDLLEPALERSRDSTVREIARALDNLVIFESSLELSNLKMGPLDPALCGDCRWNGQTCSDLCESERRFLVPASIAAGGLEMDLGFGGHPRVEQAGLVYEGNPTLADFFDGLVNCGVPRPQLQKTLREIFATWADRCRAFSVPAGPTALAPADSLIRGFLAWRATYAPELPSLSPRTDAATAPQTLDTAYNHFVVSLLRTQPATRPAATRLERAARYNARMERQLAEGKIGEFEYKSTAIDCEALSGHGRARGSCAEVSAGSAALMPEVMALATQAPVPVEHVVSVAEALEHFTFARVPARIIGERFRDLLTSTGAIVNSR